jgi:hypothetical protein
MTGERRSPTVRRRRLASVLRDLRDTDGRSSVEIARELGWSHQSRVTRLEHAEGLTLPKPAEIGRLLDVYGVTADQREAILTLASECREHGWWEPYKGVLAGPYGTYIGLEAEASLLRNYEPLLIPGLFQTEAYTRALIAARHPDLPADTVDNLVAVRAARRAHLLYGDDPARVWAVIGEAALRLQVGGPAVMADQLEHLHTLAQMPNPTIVVVPATQGMPPAYGPFVILTFVDSGGDPETVFLEGAIGDRWVEDEPEVGGFVLGWERLLAVALERNDTLAMIAAIAADHRKTGGCDSATRHAMA